MNTTVNDLSTKQCRPCEGGMPPLSPDEITLLMQQLDGWEFLDTLIRKVYNFNNYYQTMAFVNASRLGFASRRSSSGHHRWLQ